MSDINRERRARSALARQGFRLCKSRTRNERLPEWQRFHIVNENNIVVAGCGPWPYTMDLDEVEAWFQDDRDWKGELNR